MQHGSASGSSAAVARIKKYVSGTVQSVRDQPASGECFGIDRFEGKSMTLEELALEPNLRALQHAQSIRGTDPMRALNQFRALADRGSPLAMAEIAFMHGRGIGVQANALEEETWYKRAAEAGSVHARFALAYIYFRTQRHSEAFGVCQSAASRHAPAMYFLAYMYGQGVGTERDLDKERYLLHQAMQLGHLWARVRLGHVLMQGRSGTWQRLRGLFLLVSGAICAMYVAARNPKDERLHGHDVLHPFESLRQGSTTPNGRRGSL
jgi:TPR repeat protein